MRKTGWLRVAAVLSLGVLPLTAGCQVDDTPPPPRFSDGGTADMTVAVTHDMSVADMVVVPGGIGSACTQTSDCKFGAQPVCWMRNVQEMPGNIATPGGYCTSACLADADCVGQGICAAVGSGKFCVQKCAGANTCRHPDYACFVLSPNSGYCWPSLLLTCNPTSGNGTCAGVSPAAACIRRAFEDLGECQTVCPIGSNTCAFLPNGGRQHCVYVNTTVDTGGQPTRDKFKGAACFPLFATPKQEGQSCQYFDECDDSLECNLSPGGDKKCHQLCEVNVVGACPDMTQKCKDVFMAGAGNPGLCL